MFKLAIVLKKSIAEIEALSSYELSEWIAYSKIEPLPDAHWDAALIAYTIASVNAGKKKLKFEDFLPTVESKTKKHSKSTAKEMREYLRCQTK